MARSKASIYACIAFVLLIVIVIIVVPIAIIKKDHRKEPLRTAAVAADSEKCSKIGRDILKSGGSAVDGAIAALLCTSVVNPQSMGLGGGSIFTVMDSNGSQWIGVPGEIRGYEQAHRLYGKLPWADLFRPTIRLAREGLPVSQILGRYIQRIIGNKTIPLRQLFVDKDGNLLKVGDTVKFEKLADTLDIIAKQGAEAFYTGKVAEDLISDVTEAGGTLSLKDLEMFKVNVTDALTNPLGEFQMHFPPPPSGGLILSFILNIMKGYKLNPTSLMGEQKTLTYQHYIEAYKFSNGLRKNIRDPRFSSEERSLKIIKQEFADQIRAMISSNTTHDAQYYNVTSFLDTIGTSHVSLIAEDGSAVSVTATINDIFGSTVFSPKTGIILNNQLADFCGEADHIVAGERPPSSMSPVILRSQYKTVVIGGAGGSAITTGMALTLMNYVWFGKTLEEAISDPVVHVNSNNKLNFEPGFDQVVVEDLKALGHTVEDRQYFYNVVNAVEKYYGCIHAVSDARKMGKSAFYFSPF
ncbi:glutathione hydrolase 5 proenzyme isoform X2 [Esox lucius]|uniref:glutathione hydrolase 5 proenzyme isoform X2 n=1 Tax=Esox lucius TaxID=8010 RepID=UPI000973343A|nr:glutathione hydrolase 5 proenzyme isoform X2 [Esox lucius]